MTRLHDPASHRPKDLLRHYVGDLVYGANDGLITTFTVVSGVAGARLAPSIVVILGVVNLLADGLSMGSSSFLSIRSTAGAEGSDRGIREPLIHSVATFGAFVVVGFVPLVAHVFPGAGESAFLVSCCLTGTAMFIVGALRSLVMAGSWIRRGAEMLLIGAGAASVAFIVGRFTATLVG